ncbi:hypothetical protein K4F52_010239 [Lecanicillium sp. MT-2017a]|nr:hypothetical protein K4F52_010239 [Lecanicillium sp. MT-2017a]
MAVQTMTYSVADYNALPDFADSLREFDALRGAHLAGGVMKDLFRKHGVETKLGLALLHKHCTLNADERMTEVRGTSNPITFSLGKPHMWKLNLDRLVPLEFSLGQCDTDWEEHDMQEFLGEFWKTLVTYKADKVLGLCRYPGDGYPGRVEFTAGRSNINLTPQEAEALPSAGTREAAWFYTDDYMKRGCKCNCFDVVEHRHSHGYTT